MIRYTPEFIDTLKSGEIFVFGSNEAGIHGAGAARIAHQSFGAKLGLGFGGAGQTFALPTKDWNIEVLPLDIIKFYVDRFVEYVKRAKSHTFLITKVGCGLAGYTVEDIAPLFKGLHLYPNVVLPKEFCDIYEQQDKEVEGMI
jgi:hypothetical protein